MHVVWVPLGAVLAWSLLGALIGIAAALWKRLPVALGIMAGFVLGPLTLVMFFGPAEDTFASNSELMTVYAKSRSPRFALRRCPECTGPNASLTWQEMTGKLVGDDWGDFGPGRRQVFIHRYRCIVCGYEWEFESPLMDPDKPPKRVY